MSEKETAIASSLCGQPPPPRPRSASSPSSTRPLQKQFPSSLSKVTARPVDSWKAAGGAEAYRCLLFSTGVEVKDAQKENVVRQGVTADEARQVLKDKGRLSGAKMVRLRVRYFSDGLVLGSKAFVESVFSENRDKLGPKRSDGARKVSESESPLYSLRRLRLRALGI